MAQAKRTNQTSAILVLRQDLTEFFKIEYLSARMRLGTLIRDFHDPLVKKDALSRIVWIDIVVAGYMEIVSMVADKLAPLGRTI